MTHLTGASPTDPAVATADVRVPIWDTAGGTGSNGWYHIVGFAGFQITECRGGKDIAGVWRKAIFQGPVGSTPTNPLVPQAPGVQLLK